MSSLVKKYSIKINNADLTADQYDGFLSFSLNQSIHSHHNLSLTFRQDSFDLDTSLFSSSKDFLGKKIELVIEITESSDKLIFIGIITAVNTNRSNSYSGDMLVVNALSPDIVLDDGSACRSFSEKSLEQIIQELIRPYDLICPFNIEVQNFPGPRSYIVQYKETSFQFINRLAAKYGQWFFYNGKEITFGKLNQPKSRELTYGRNLFDFGINLKLEPFTFGFISYDPFDNGKQLYESSDNGKPFLGNITELGKLIYKASENLFPTDSKVLYNHPLTTGDQQKHLDDRIIIKKSGKAAGLETFNGESDIPSLKIGDKLTIVEFIDGKRTEHGDYTIISLDHSADHTGQYSNRFSAIPASLQVPPTSNPHSFPFCETQSAIVEDNNDPDNLGRIRVKFFWQENEITPWIRIVNPYAGYDKGHHFIPENGEEVLVAFEAGNAEKPFILGSMYHAKAKPETWKTDNNDIKAIRTRSGHTIEFDDTDGKEEIRIFDHQKNNFTLTFRSHKQEIIIEAVENIELKAKNISIIAEKDLKFEATDVTEKAGGNKKTDVSGNINTSANGNISTKSSGNTTQEASADMTVKGGANTTLQAGAKATIKAGGQLEESAPIIKIN